MDYYIIGQQIRKIRKSKSLSQEVLAEKVGISTTHMSHIETGNTKLSLAVLVKIALVLNVTTDELLFSPTLKTDKMLINQTIQLLEECGPKELSIIVDVIQTMHSSLNKHINLN